MKFLFIFVLQSDVKLIKAGDKVGASEATLLNMLKISPFTYGLEIEQGMMLLHWSLLIFLAVLHKLLHVCDTNANDVESISLSD